MALISEQRCRIKKTILQPGRKNVNRVFVDVMKINSGRILRWRS